MALIEISRVFCARVRGRAYDFTEAGSRQNRSHHILRLFASGELLSCSSASSRARRASLSPPRLIAARDLGGLYVRERRIPPRYAGLRYSSVRISTSLQIASVYPPSQPVSMVSARSSLKLKSETVLLFLSFLSLLDSLWVPWM